MATYETAETCFITVSGIKFAYRQLGPRNGVPLVLFTGFRRTMDHWDPALINPLAAKRPVILIDNAGVGWSAGQVPKSFTVWAEHYINALRALGVSKTDVLGYSMGGCVAQLVALNAPGLVRKLILCGTIPSTGEGVTRAPIGPFNQIKDARTEEEHRRAFLSANFTTSARSQAAGAAAYERIAGARRERADHVNPASSRLQGIASAKFMDPKQAQTTSYNRFDELQMPVLIASANDDQLLPMENSILMWKMLRQRNARLHLFSDAGHGFLYQYADEFAELINAFLDRDDGAAKTSSRL